MSTLRRLIGTSILNELESATRSSAASPVSQGEHIRTSAAVVSSYCDQLAKELKVEEAFDDAYKRSLLRKVDRTLVGLAHLRDQIDPPAQLANHLANDGLLVDYVNSVSQINERRHDAIVDQQFTYHEDCQRIVVE